MQAVTSFSVEPPKPKRLYVIARDPETGKSRSMTVFGVDADSFIQQVRDIAKPEQPKRRRRSEA